MKIKKEEAAFNTYKLDLSYGELLAIRDALEAKHAGVVADEVYAGLNWYLERLPKPGEEEEDEKEEKATEPALERPPRPPERSSRGRASLTVSVRPFNSTPLN